jgi:hypothetical protein
MKARFLLTVAGSVAAATLVAACSGSPAPSTGATPASPSQTGKTLPYAGAPKVENPLPESVLSGHPCDGGLTPAQLNEILRQQPQGKRNDDPSLGAECQWPNSDTGALVTVAYTTKVTDGLSAVYANTKPKATVWRPLPPIQGFPAVAHSSFSQERSKSFCQVTVGISDQYTVDVSVDLGETKVGKVDPCDVTATVAGMVVTNLRQKAGS